MKSQNIIIYHKILPVNYKKNLKIQRDFDFLWPLHPAFRVQSSMFQLLLRNSWGEHKAMNLAFWWIILKSFSPSFYQNVKINSFFSHPLCHFCSLSLRSQKRGKEIIATESTGGSLGSCLHCEIQTLLQGKVFPALVIFH